MACGDEGSTRARAATLAVATTACSGLLFFFGTGLAPVAALAWLAPLPALLLAPRVSAWASTAVAFFGYLLGTANSWSYYLHSQDMPLPAGVSVSVGAALVFVLAAALFRALIRQGHAFLATVTAPAVWTGCVYLVGASAPNGVMGTMAWSHADVPVVLQLASLIGVWGVEFLVLLAASAVAALLAPRVTTAARLRAGVITAVVFALAFGWGALRLSTAENAASSQRVALVSTSQGHWGENVTTPEGKALLEAYVDQIAALPDGVSTVVLPEAVFAIDETSRSALVEPMTRAARARGSDLVVGVIRHDQGLKFNAALAIPAGGGEPAEYHKWNNGGATNVTPGHDLTFLPGTRVGIQICMDVNFANPSRDYATAGARLVAVPASDENANGWQHSRTALLRGVENGFAVAWSGQKGTLTLSDGFGRVLAEKHSSGPAPFTTTVADVPMGPGATPYTRFGDGFAWLCLAVAIGGLVTTSVTPLQRYGAKPGASTDTHPSRDALLDKS